MTLNQSRNKELDGHGLLTRELSLRKPCMYIHVHVPICIHQKLTKRGMVFVEHKYSIAKAIMLSYPFTSLVRMQYHVTAEDSIICTYRHEFRITE